MDFFLRLDPGTETVVLYDDFCKRLLIRNWCWTTDTKKARSLTLIVGFRVACEKRLVVDDVGEVLPVAAATRVARRVQAMQVAEMPTSTILLLKSRLA